MPDNAPETPEQEQVAIAAEAAAQLVDIEEDRPELVEVAEEPVDQVEQPETSQEWRNDQLAWGQAIGLTPEEVKQVGSPALFDKMVANVQGSMYTGAEQQTQAAAGQVQEESPAAGDVGFKFDDPDDYDDEIVKMNEHYGSKINEMETHLNAMMLQTQRMQMEAAGREMDAIMDGMDNELYGRGRLNDVPEDLAMNRISVADEVARLGHGYLARGEQVPPLDDLVGRASQAVHGKEISNQALKRVSDKAGRIARQATALPTHTDEVSESGEAAARAAAAEWLRERGDSEALT